MDQDDIYVREEVVDEVSVYNRHKIRVQLQSEVEAFLARGGAIQQIDNNVTADPPQKPSNQYGSLSI